MRVFADLTAHVVNPLHPDLPAIAVSLDACCGAFKTEDIRRKESAIKDVVACLLEQLGPGGSMSCGAFITRRDCTVVHVFDDG